MMRAAGYLVLATALVGLGWSAGRAQSSQPQFEIVVNAPAGETTIECLRGCRLAWIERGINPMARPKATFTFNCRGAVSRCSSARVGGWGDP